ncbi:MAG: protein kinase [Fuerstiella sp.]|nr:protein kinase [Fuerstiella sp.]MCP4854968.1 protein kinase [Fuerstiella sp.]
MTNTVICPACSEATSLGADFDDLPPLPGEVVSKPGPTPAVNREISATEFLQHVAASDLDITGTVDRFLTDSPDAQTLTDGRQLADELVGAKLLTEYQATVLTSSLPEPLRLGDFSILDQIGRGGMGVVYRARHTKVDREVALKVLPPQFSADADAIERFEREANAAAQLQHDNIVTVFEVGHDKGRHFFAMQLVEGESLSQRLRGGPLENIRAAEILESICRAVAFAHSKGILHRDLKPANILLDAHSGRPLVADFGLAKLAEQPDELTYSGVMMGTPQYVSPEQARDAAKSTSVSDVYSLGATLYHVLTGRPPFQAANAIDTVRQVLDADPVSPRQLNSTVSRDLDTICLKCLEKIPAARFSSAEELADELQRIVEGRPIVSRPLSSTQQLMRWCRRNPLVASLSAVVIASVMAALLATSIGLYEVSVARDEAETELRTAISVVDDLLVSVSEETLLNQPGMQPLKEGLLKKALAYLQGFIERRGDDPQIRVEIASVWYSVALIQQQIRDPKAALGSLRNARQIYARMPDSDPSIQRALAQAWNVEGQVLKATAEYESAAKAFEEALSLRRELASTTNDSLSHRQLANTIMNAALLKKDLAIHEGTVDLHLLSPALGELQKAQAIRQMLLTDEPRNVAVLRDVAVGAFNIATLYHESFDEQRDPVATAGAFQTAVDAFGTLRSADSSSLNDQYLEAVSWRLLADNLTGDELAIQAYSRAEELAQQLSVRNPDVVDWRLEFSKGLVNYGVRLASIAEDEASLLKLTEATRHLRNLATIDSRATEISRELGLALHMAGLVHDQLGDSKRAIESLQEAIKVLSVCLQSLPDDPHVELLLEDSRAALREIADSAVESSRADSDDSGDNVGEKNQPHGDGN